MNMSKNSSSLTAAFKFLDLRKRISTRRSRRKRSRVKDWEEEQLFQLVKETIEDNGNLNQYDKYGSTILHHVANKGYTDVARMILEHTSTGVVLTDAKLNTAAHLAARRGHEELFEMLLDNMSKNLWTVRNCKRRTLLHEVAAGCNKKELIEKLLAAKLSIHDKDIYKQTALHRAVRKENWRIIPLLLGAGALNEEDKKHCTPLFMTYAKADTSLKRKESLVLLLNLLHKDIPKEEYSAEKVIDHKVGAERQEHVLLTETIPEMYARMEREFHNDNLTEMKKCVWNHLGPNRRSQDVVSVMTNAEDNFSLLTDSSFLNFFLMHLINLFVDLWRAQESTWSIRWIAWLFRAIVIAPSIVYLISYTPKSRRKSDLFLGLTQQQSKALYNRELKGQWFMKFYNHTWLAIPTSILQLWPMVVFGHRRAVGEFVEKLKNDNSPLTFIYEEHWKLLDAQIEPIERWQFFSATVNLIIWMYTTPKQEFWSLLLLFKIHTKTLTIISFLFEEEACAKFPVEILDRGKVLLFACFTFRVLSRVFCLTECLHIFGMYTFFAYPFHLVIASGISCFDILAHYRNCEKCALNLKLISLMRVIYYQFLHLMINLYNYIPPQFHKKMDVLPGRIIYTILLFLEDTTGVVCLYVFVQGDPSSIFLLNSFFAGFVVMCWAFSTLFIILYYKYGHPWAWMLQPSCCSTKQS